MPVVVTAVNVAGRLLMDAAMIAPIVHVFSRLPDRVLVGIMRGTTPTVARSTDCC